METLLNLFCHQCGSSFTRSLSRANRCVKRNDQHVFCSVKCTSAFQRSFQTVVCLQCATQFEKSTCQIRHSPRNFCTKSCAAVWRNTHKTTGTRRSKLEVFVERELTLLFPVLDIRFNEKNVVGSELDVYFPELKLAFELNGIYHYEPIHGIEKLGQIQTNDTRKFNACSSRGISLCVIDTSQLKYFKEQRARDYLDIIVELVNQHALSAGKAVTTHLHVEEVQNDELAGTRFERATSDL